MSRRLFLVLVLAYLVLRVGLGLLPGYVLDLHYYKNCALGAALKGLPFAYDTTGFDYPPLYLYILYPIGKLQLWMGGDFGDVGLFTLMMKTPHLLFDLVLAGLIYRLVGVVGLWGADRVGPAWGRMAALLYLGNPAVVWGSGYWGMPDSIHSALALATLSLLIHDRWFAGGMTFSAAGMMKPMVAPLVPLLTLLVIVRRRTRGLAVFASGGIAVAALVFLPFILNGRGLFVLQRVVFDLDIMPYTSVNAHNLWWLVSGGWQPADTPVVGSLTPTLLGLIGFGMVFALLAWRSREWLAADDEPRSILGAKLCIFSAALCAAFFFLTTHMHENHLFLTIPLLVCVAGRHRSLAWLTVGATVALLGNMLLHDLDLPYALPLGLSLESPIVDPLLDRPYTWLQVVGSRLIAVLSGAVTVGLCLATWRIGGRKPPMIARG